MIRSFDSHGHVLLHGNNRVSITVLMYIIQVTTAIQPIPLLERNFPMKHFYAFATVSTLCIALFSCAKQSETSKKELTNDREKFSYAIGLEIGVSLQQMKDEIDLPSLFQAIKDTLKGSGNLLAADEAQAIKSDIFKRLRDQKMAEQKLKDEATKKEGDAFLDKNKTKEGVITTESGLQYIVLKEGNGPKPTESDKVKVHYEGRLLDGTVFDSSIKRGAPAEFSVSGVIKGWSEALQLMKTGSKYKLFIPPDLAYGERGAGSAIPPNSTLVFELELLEIVH